LPTPFDVPPSIMIERLAQYLKNNIDSVTRPIWASFVKTGIHAQKTPDNPNWWYIRCASLIRKIYTKGPIGIGHLRSEYGGRKDYGSKPEHAERGSGAIIRNALHQLEKAGLVKKLEKEGRVITPIGRKLLDTLSTEIKKELEKENPELKKY
jgi:small subunit ribosomal protein S19e